MNVEEYKVTKLFTILGILFFVDTFFYVESDKRFGGERFVFDSDGDNIGSIDEKKYSRLTDFATKEEAQ